VGNTIDMKQRHPGQLGVPEWWPLVAWLITFFGVLLILGGVAGLVIGNLLAGQVVLVGALVAVLPWANAFARGTMQPGWVAISGAEARQAAQRLRYVAGFVAGLAGAGVLLAVLIARDALENVGPLPGGLVVALTPLLVLAFLLLALLLWLRARDVERWS
jgi:hypothetical protein